MIETLHYLAKRFCVMGLNEGVWGGRGKGLRKKWLLIPLLSNRKKYGHSIIFPLNSDYYYFKEIFISLELV